MLSPSLTLAPTTPVSTTQDNGNTFTVNTTLTNNGTGETDNITYCVEDNANAEIQEITFTVGGNSITLDATADGVVEAGGLCFTLDDTQLTTLTGTGVLASGATIDIEESWLVVGCDPVTTDLKRKAQYGCEGNENCAAVIYDDFSTTALTVNVYTSAVDITVDAPTEISACGSVQTVNISLENIAGSNDDLTLIKGFLELPAGISIVGVTGDVTLEAVTDSIVFPNPLLATETLNFSVQIKASCDLVAGSADFPFFVRFAALPCVSVIAEVESSATVAFLEADLTLSATTPASTSQDHGNTFTIATTLTNNGPGETDNLTYCVEDNPNAEIQEITFTVGGNSITLDATADGVAEGGGLCFTLEDTQLTALNGSGVLASGATIDIEETWLVTNCDPPVSVLKRKVQYGCEGNDNCAAADYDDFPDTPLAVNVYSNALDVTIDIPLEITACGPIETITITLDNILSGANDDLSNLKGFVDLPEGVELIDIMGPVSLEAGTDSIIFDNQLLAGQSVSFSVKVRGTCALESGSADFPFFVRYDPLPCLVASSELELTSGGIFFQAADLSMPGNTIPTTVPIYPGLIFDVIADVANGGNGILDTVIYCLENHPNAAIQSIMVGNITIDQAFSTDGDFTCFAIASDAFLDLFGTTYLPDNTGFDVKETWVATTCATNPPDLRRRVQFGCEGNYDCQDKDQGVYPTTGITYNTLLPDLTISLNTTNAYPACYWNENSMVTVTITNNGDSPAKDIVLSISAGAGALELGSYMVLGPDGLPLDDPTIETVNNDDPGGCTGGGIGSIVDIMEDMLEVGESITFSYQIDHSCSADCAISAIYQSTVSATYRDLCEEEFSDSNSTASYDAGIVGFSEAPIDILPGEKATVEFVVNSITLDWFDGNYPEAYIESVIPIPPGLDYVVGSATWTDLGGSVWPLCLEDYMDTEGGTDNVTVRWCYGNLPPTFDISAGVTFNYCVVPDCDELPDAADCGNPIFEMTLTRDFFIVTDPDCVPECPMPFNGIGEAEPITVRVFCPENGCPGGGGCEGVTFAQLDIERANFGFADDNNDQDPEVLDMIDLNLVQKDRFLPGDTLKATFQGLITDTGDPSFWDDGYASIFLPFSEFSPVSAQVEIFDADGSSYVCNVVPLSVDVGEMRLTADFSIATLNGLGCGLDPGFTNFEGGDSIALCIYFEVKRPFEGMEDAVEFATEFYVTDGDYGVGTPNQCFDRQARLTQIGIRESEDCDFSAFGACDLPGWSVTHSLHYGFSNFDEFPYEVRPLGVPKQITFTKSPEFPYRPELFVVRLIQNIPPQRIIVDLPDGSIPPEYIIENGDDLTILSADYFNSLGLSTIPPDEGFTVVYYPKVQGSCQSVASPPAYPISYVQEFFVDENVFCTPLITTETMNKNFTYSGGAELVVESEQSEIRLCSAQEIVSLQVRNVSNSTAPNAFFYAASELGSIIALNVFVNGIEIPSEGFGIYALGDIAPGQSIPIEVFIIPNNCLTDQLNFIAGWDCESLPTTVDEALCSDPSSILFTVADAGINLDVLNPVTDQLVTLCEPVYYEAEVRSTDLGYLRGIVTRMQLPPGMSYVPGTFEMAYPAISQGGTYMSFDDTNLIPVAGGFEVNLSELDPILSTEGLIGSKDLTLNKVNFRFQLETDCGFVNGSRVRFFAKGNNTCGDPLPTVVKPSGRIRVSDDLPQFSVIINEGNLDLNPCAEEMQDLFVSLILESGDVSMLDSTRIILPPGVEYVPNTYLNIQNAGDAEPEITTNNGIQVLTWPFETIALIGTNISFKVKVMAMDVAQECTEYEIIVQAFASAQELCNGELCDIGLLAGEGIKTLTITKPELSFTQFEATLTLQTGGGQAQGDFVVTLLNNGNVLPAGEVITVDIYEDIDNNGVRSPADNYLTSITEILTQPLASGASITITATDIFVAGEVCTLIGVLNPFNTCVCSEVPSFQINPEIIIDFQTEFEVCSGVDVEIGPQPVTNYDFEWLSVNGSPLTALTVTEDTPTTFNLSNTTGADQTVQYALRTSVATCYVYDTVTITVFPENIDLLEVAACENNSFNLPSLNLGGSDFVWAPDDGLSFPGPDDSYAVVDLVTGSETYVLTYLDGNGCPASLTIELEAVDCGTAITGLGDTVWFDYNLDGLQSPGEPGIEGVVVNLYDGTTGSLLSSTITDENGYYIFDNLVQGNYFVGFTPLPGFIATVEDAFGDTDDDDDSDANMDTGFTGNYFLPWDTFNPTIDAGFIPNCSIDLEVALGDCQVVGDEVLRTVDVTVSWQDNPYTYDQFFEADTLEVTFLGETYRIIADTLFGEETITVMVNPLVVTSLDVTAQFVIDTQCEATASGPDLTPCVYDLALTKQPGNGTSFTYGDTLCLDIIIYNQGQQPVSNITVNDYLPSGFGFLPDLNPQWSQTAPDRLVGLMTDTLSVGEQDTLILKLELLMATGADAYTNVAEIGAFQDTLGTDFSDFDEDSTPDDIPDNDPGGEPDSPADDYVDGNGTGSGPGPDAVTDEDDQDPFRVDVFDLALIKRIDTPPPYAFGQTIDFSIEVTNQGNVTAQNILVTDYIPDGFSWLTSNEPAWDFTTGEPYNIATQTIAGPLVPGATETITIQLTLVEADMDQYVNIAEISYAEDLQTNPRFDDVDSTPDSNPDNDAGGNPNTDSDNVNNGDGTGDPGDTNPTTDEDDQDPAYVTVSDVEVVKTAIGVVPAATAGNFYVTYQISMENTGNTVLNMLQLEDDFVTQLGTSFVGIQSAPVILGTSTASVLPSLNPGFTGNSVNSEIFTGTDGTLQSGEIIAVQLTLELTSLSGTEPATNEATGSGIDPFDEPVTDMDDEAVTLPDCFLDVVCPNPNGGTFQCPDEVPVAAIDVATFNAIDGFSAIANACGPVTITHMDVDNGGSGCIGDALVITRTYTINDPGDGTTTPETETCVVTYTVIDNRTPVIQCPDPVTTSCLASDVPVFNTFTEFVAGGGYAEDNCGIDAFNYLGQTSNGNSCPEVFTRTYEVKDECGNTSTCTQTITVNDIQPPVVNCIPLESTCFNTDIPPYLTYAEFIAAGNTASDNCGVDPASFTLVSEDTLLYGCPLVIERLYQISDLCGNVSCCGKQLISYVDEEAPVFDFLPSNLSLSCSDVIPPAPVLTATDNCTTPDIAFSESDNRTDIGLCSDYSYTITRTWIASDDCGNQTFAQQFITIDDSTPPTAMCCPAFSVNIGDEPDGVITLNPADLDCGSTDNCTPDEDLQFTISPNNFTLADLGTQTVTLTITDVCGNTSSCDVEVTIVEQPEIGLAKRAVSVVDNPDGTSTVIYEFNIENSGDVDLADVQVTDDLTAAFGAPCTLTVDAITSDDFLVDASYTGTGQNNMLLPGNNLQRGDIGSVLLTITVGNCGLNFGTFNNQATVTATSPGGVNLTDLSHNGSDPDPNGDGPGDNEDMTPVNFSFDAQIGVAKRNVQTVLLPDGSANVTFEFNIENFGNVNLSDISLIDDLAAAFPATLCGKCGKPDL